MHYKRKRQDSVGRRIIYCCRFPAWCICNSCLSLNRQRSLSVFCVRYVFIWNVELPLLDQTDFIWICKMQCFCIVVFTTICSWNITFQAVVAECIISWIEACPLAKQNSFTRHIRASKRGIFKPKTHFILLFFSLISHNSVWSWSNK